jgi:demethylmenaquinone methyltransferase/2-methoxy-6-polyprenyl-1,4-benzoquinol methylase
VPELNVGGKSPDEVRAMFSRVAPRYDLANHLLSLGFDFRWRRAAARALPPLRDGEWVADCCAGTGDLALAFARAAPGARLVALDFAPEMLRRATAKAEPRRAACAQSAGQVAFVLADALALPLRDESLAAIGIAFGLRNLAEPARAIREMARVVRPGGRVIILEFALPEAGWWGSIYGLYLRRVLPVLARVVAPRSGDAYAYLAHSVEAFARRGEVCEQMRAAGLAGIRERPLTGGLVRLYVGGKPAAAAHGEA